MATATDIRKGSVLVMDGDLYVCTEFIHKTPGNLRGNVQVDKRLCEYLYKDAAGHVFMDCETYEQIHLPEDQIADQIGYIKENAQVQVTFHETNPVSVELPGTVELTVTHTEPGIKGDTVSNVYKPATLETGLEIKVPNHVAIGDVIKVSTQTGEFQGRVQ